MLLRQRPSVIKNICEAFHLSQTEKEHLLTASIGEGLLIMEDEHSKIKVIASPEEHSIITTNADELLVQKTEVKKESKKQPEVNVNLDKRFYKRKELNPDEIKFLLSQGYKELLAKSINSNKKEDFILKPRFNEGVAHMFFVYDIKEYLEKSGANVQLYITKMPDLICEINGKKFAFEVETGSVISNPNRIKEKVALIKGQNYNEWYFVLTTKHLVTKYKKYGKTIDPRSLKGALDKIIKKI
jgi:hypothetical protein